MTYCLEKLEMKRKGEVFIPEQFELTPATLEWLAAKYPQIDVAETLERFIGWAEADGVMYANWQRAFQNVVRKGMDNGWRSIVTLKAEKAKTDTAWQILIAEGRKFGFREPHAGEGFVVYRSELEFFKKQPQRPVSRPDTSGRVLNLDLLRKVS